MPDTQLIAELNDKFRRGEISGRWLFTSGVMALPNPYQIVRLVQTYNQFSSDSDPWGEKDFGSFDYAGERLYWKIDAYSKTLDAGSEDPTDLAATTRVITVLLSSEY